MTDSFHVLLFLQRNRLTNAEACPRIYWSRGAPPAAVTGNSQPPGDPLYSRNATACVPRHLWHSLQRKKQSNFYLLLNSFNLFVVIADGCHNKNFFPDVAAVQF